MSRKDVAFLSMLSALAFVSVMFIKIPIMPSAPFLRFDLRDSIIIIGGLIYGPAAAFGVSFVAGLLQFLLMSEYGIIGFVMNLLSTVSFVCTASAVYRLKKTRAGLVLGLAVGCAFMTVSMLLWNYIITPLFMGVPREVVGSMLLTVFMPFNLLKGGINSVIILLYIRPLFKTLASLNLYDADKES